MKYIFIVFLFFSLTACERSVEANKEAQPSTAVTSKQNVTAKTNTRSEADDVASQTVTLLEFQEVEAGVDPYQTRMLVSDEYIRIDEGGGKEGFVLFDRQNKRIYSVLASSERILVVDPLRPLGDVPEGLILESKQIEDDQMPLVYGKRPNYYQFTANGIQCYHVIAVNSLLPEVVTALIDYQGVLAAQQLENLNNTPEELQTPCFLANYIYATTDYLSKGFPIEQWDDTTDYRRSLIRFDVEHTVDGNVFKLPEGMSFFTMGGEDSIAL